MLNLCFLYGTRLDCRCWKGLRGLTAASLCRASPLRGGAFKLANVALRYVCCFYSTFQTKFEALYKQQMPSIGWHLQV